LQNDTADPLLRRSHNRSRPARRCRRSSTPRLEGLGLSGVFSFACEKTRITWSIFDMKSGKTSIHKPEPDHKALIAYTVDLLRCRGGSKGGRAGRGPAGRGGAAGAGGGRGEGP